MPDNGQVECLNRTLKDATVRSYHYESHEQLREHPGRLRGLQLRQAAEGSRRTHALRSHLQSLDEGAAALQAIAGPPHIGTEHLALPPALDAASSKIC
jgi:hypothetical protein